MIEGSLVVFGRLLRALLRPQAGKHPAKDRKYLMSDDAPTRGGSKRYNSPQINSADVAERFEPTTAKLVERPKVISGPAYVVDGDTIKVRQVQVRLFGIDAPELNHPYGRKAKSALLDMCRGQTVHAEILEMDDHGRTVALCRMDDGRDLSAEMVKLGLAIDWPKFSGGTYRELETEDARKKLWLADARQKGRLDLWHRYDIRDGRKVTVTSEPHAEAVSTLTSDCFCPRCGSAMIKKPNRKTGTEFWGCSEYPKCRGSRSVS